MPPNLQPLPIDEVLDRIIENLRSHGRVVLQAEPGAGKTTRVAPAILDKLLIDDESSRTRKIILLQPRRVAARAAATRIAEERGTELGGEVGYQVRFEKRLSKNTRILVCTEGVFLRRLQEDPLLDDVAVVVFDEFHERSIDSDLSLALVRQVRNELRDDLKVVVMSATLDASPVSRFLDDCPIVTCPGRTHKIHLEYLQFSPNESIERLTSDGIRKVVTGSGVQTVSASNSTDASDKVKDGNVLVFLPGVGEIRRVQEQIEENHTFDDYEIMPLYGDMTLEEQQKVLRFSEQKKIVLATNVAETSITIDGITAVVDSGLARVNRLDPRLGLNRLELARISKASAEQRAGRAGRTAEGKCLRLWSEREQQMLNDFQEPEIARVELSQSILQLFAWGETNIRSFPWFEAPPPATLEQALQLLERLGAIADGKLTELGKRMADLPLQPRLARLLLEGEHLGQARRVAICAALLGERDPIKRSRQSYKAEHHSDSDVLDRISAVEAFANNGTRHSEIGELLSGPTKQILRVSDQLLQSLDKKKSNNSIDSDAAVLKALLSAFPDRVCRRRDARGRRALMVGGRGVKLGDESAVGSGELFLAIEILDSGQSESLVMQASMIERSWLNQAQITTSIETSYDPTREKIVANKRTRFCDLIIDEAPIPVPTEIDVSELLAKSVQERFDLASLLNEEGEQYLARIQCLAKWMPELSLPDFGESPLTHFLRTWCLGCSSVQELRNKSLIEAIQSELSHDQLSAIEREAPSKITVPSGSRIKVQYEAEKPPVVAVRVQEVFGLKETPRIAASRVPVLLHLLAPNYQIQQITTDLSSFWKNSYNDVKKDLRRRYPKHSWPDDPLTAQAEHRPQRKKPNV